MKTPSSRNAWIDLLERAGSKRDVAVACSQTIRPHLALTKQTSRSKITGGSKIGGTPDLPATVAWPTRQGYSNATKQIYAQPSGHDAHSERAIDFILQLDLAAASTAGALDIDLPQTGYLWFFYDAVCQPWGMSPPERAGWSLIWRDTSDLEPRPRPADSVRAPAFNEYQLGFRPESSLAPSVLDPAYGRDAHNKLPLDVLETLEELLVSRSSGFGRIHKLGGWPDEVQDPNMGIECEAASQGIERPYLIGQTDPKRWKEIERAAQNWRLVLQIDSDEHVGWMWGDMGVIYVWMRETDIAARRFDRAWVILQCT